MTERSIYDYVLDNLAERQRDVRVELADRFRKTQPFRTEKVSDREMLYNYSQMSPEVKNSLRQSMGDSVMDEYELKMRVLQEKIARKNNG